VATFRASVPLIVGKIGPNPSICVGQGYDGAASLSGERIGAASRFLADAKKAKYVVEMFFCPVNHFRPEHQKVVSIRRLKCKYINVQNVMNESDVKSESDDLKWQYVADSIDNLHSKCINLLAVRAPLGTSRS